MEAAASAWGFSVMETIEKVICASCGWKGRRKTGKLVECPRCGEVATFDVRDKRAGSKV